ncbi:MAG: DUF2520 domain-containing protein [Bacteroidales bacterium]|jgi:predicted short-subunit dehydrogenase-like oxidoreductase (DUF2520 family)|nr:DUF2520 domain-containing protein [Bacteroidales bacterium]
MKIAVMGSGNIAHHLAPALARNNEVVQMKRDTVPPDADIYFLLVPDTLLYEVAKTLRVSEKTVVHVSGATPLEIISPISNNAGVMYFIQTFSKNSPQLDFSDIPVCIEASNAETENLLTELARELSNNVRTITSEERALIHLAAVFANNFTNALYGIAEMILPQNDLSLLYPMIEETARKIKFMSAKAAQTGPASRNDRKTFTDFAELFAVAAEST